MIKEVDWWKFPEGLAIDLLEHYTRIECLIFLELELAGIEITYTDFNDEDWSRYISFATKEDLDLFLSMAEFEDHLSGFDWEVEDHEEENIQLSCIVETYFKEAGLTVCIRRVDLNTVRRNLKRMNAIFVEDYDEKKQQAILRESKTSPAISDSMILCKDY